MKEKELSIALGLSRDLLKEFRDSYIENDDWKKIPSRKPEKLWEVEWTPEGVLKLRKNLGMAVTEAIAAPEHKSGTVTAKHKNIRFIRALIEGKEHNVLCKDNSKFGIGMPVDVRWDGTKWCVTKHPRFQGKY